MRGTFTVHVCVMCLDDDTWLVGKFIVLMIIYWMIIHLKCEFSAVPIQKWQKIYYTPNLTPKLLLIWLNNELKNEFCISFSAVYFSKS